MPVGTPPIHDLSPVPGRGGNRTSRPGNANVPEVDRQIAELVDRSTHKLRLAWRQLYCTGPPRGLSRDLLIRALANQLQERTHGGASRALRRRLQTLAGEFERGGASFDPGVVVKIGTILVRQWRGRTHKVLVRENGFEYEGQRYRSLSVIAERIADSPLQGFAFSLGDWAIFRDRDCGQHSCRQDSGDEFSVVHFVPLPYRTPSVRLMSLCRANEP
jgi:hypothetical protein